ncbi:PspC domain-containing protein [Pararhodonellum marinum]|uniref:PspC domain-containing protein n=1 Tax=Pararhodonellum marinum TaxID=2755358 RepID=UPI00188EC48C|nr:PspC domain-containing protein [Pararhodonellum marinum]
MEKKLMRSSSDKVIAGVCGGLANYLGWESDKIRIGYVILSVISAGFPGILIYLILWFVMPEDFA